MKETDEEMCRRHLREGQGRIDRQIALIARLDAGGRDTVEARNLLQSFRDVQRMSEEHLRRIQAGH